MGKPVFLRHLESDRGTLANGSWSGTLPLANIRTNDVMQVARSTSASTSHTQFRIDWGTSAVRYADTFALINTNLTTAAKWRVALSNSSTAATTVMDSGLIDAVVSNVVWGADPWGSFSWTGTALLDGTLPPPISLYQHSSALTARYLFVWIEDAANPAGYIDIGRFVAGPGFSPANAFQYGYRWQWVDPSEQRRGAGNLRVVERRPRYRVFSGSLPTLTSADAGFFAEWSRLGIDQPALFIQDPDAPEAEGQRRVMFCALQSTPAISKPFLTRFAADIVLEELN